MSQSAVIVDTNVVVAGLLTGNDTSRVVPNVARILDGMLAASAAPDPGDPLLWGLLAARAELVLITGDKLLLRDAGMQGRVMSPSAFVSAAGHSINAA